MKLPRSICEWRQAFAGLALGAGLVFGALFVGAAFTGAGHGTQLPVLVFVGLYGVGLFVWPVAYAAMLVPRKWLLPGICLICVCIAIHIVGAALVYNAAEVERARLERLNIGRWVAMYGLIVSVVELAPLAYGLSRLDRVRSLFTTKHPR